MIQIIVEPKWVDDPETMLQVCREVRDSDVCGIDTETTGKDNPMKDHVLFWSLSPNERSRYCLSRRMLDIFAKELALDPNITWAMTNANFDNNVLINSGVPELVGPVHCTLVMDWLYDENRFGNHGLKATARDHINLNMREFKQVFKKKTGETYQDTLLRMMREDPVSAIDYASMDAWASREVHKFLADKLRRIETSTSITMWDLFEKVEVPYTKVLLHCIRRGMMLDTGWLKEIRVPITEDMEKIQRKFNKLAGREVNLNSPTQLRELFIEEMGKEPIKYTSGGKTGNRMPSVDETVLNIWAEDGDEFADLVVQFRKLGKIRGTYIDGLIARQGDDFRIHTVLNQHVAVTGRLSSSNPNMQNLPRPDTDKYLIRGAFMPKTGHTLVAADYAQLEMRLLAVMSGDKRMQEVINNGWDIHMGTASVMYGVPYEKMVEAKKIAGQLERDSVPHEKWPEWVVLYMGYRQTSKTIGFGLNYGEGIPAMAKKLGCTKEEAALRVDNYFAPYPGVKDFIDDTHISCRETLEVSTILGRKRRLLDSDADWKEGFYSKKWKKWIPERPGKLAARALRQAVNSIIQGSAADVARMAQIRCEHSKRLRDLGVEQLLQVHDELLFEVPNENLEEAKRIIRDKMENPFADLPERLGIPFRKLPVPLTVDIGFGESWSEAH